MCAFLERAVHTVHPKIAQDANSYTAEVDMLAWKNRKAEDDVSPYGETTVVTWLPAHKTCVVLICRRDHSAFVSINIKL